MKTGPVSSPPPRLLSPASLWPAHHAGRLIPGRENSRKKEGPPPRGRPFPTSRLAWSSEKLEDNLHAQLYPARPASPENRVGGSNVWSCARNYLEAAGGRRAAGTNCACWLGEDWVIEDVEELGAKLSRESLRELLSLGYGHIHHPNRQTVEIPIRVAKGA